MISKKIRNLRDIQFPMGFKKPAKNLFWVWVAYQAVKGTLTTSLIWIPLLWAWLHHT